MLRDPEIKQLHVFALSAIVAAYRLYTFPFTHSAAHLQHTVKTGYHCLLMKVSPILIIIKSSFYHTVYDRRAAVGSESLVSDSTAPEDLFQ